MSSSLSLKTAIDLTQLNGGQLVDVRDPSAFACGHQPGSLSIPYSRKGLGDRIGLFLSEDTPIIFVVEDEEQIAGITVQFEGTIERILGFVRSPLESGMDSHSELTTITEITVKQIHELVTDGYIVLDVREPIEWDTGHVPNAKLISLSNLEEELPQIPIATKVAVICEAGIRSSSAVSLLLRSGFLEVVNVTDGTSGYRQAGLPLEFPD